MAFPRGKKNERGEEEEVGSNRDSRRGSAVETGKWGDQAGAVLFSRERGETVVEDDTDRRARVPRERGRKGGCGAGLVRLLG
jgi:hypothetical protein